MNPLLLFLGLLALVDLLASNHANPSSNPPQPAPGGNPEPQPGEAPPAEVDIPASQPVTLDMLREIFQDGARPLRRRDAVEILKAAPYYVPKSNAYRALGPARRFAAHLREDEHGWLDFYR